MRYELTVTLNRHNPDAIAADVQAIMGALSQREPAEPSITLERAAAE